MHPVQTMIVIITPATKPLYKNISFPSMDNASGLEFSLQEDLQPLINLNGKQQAQAQPSSGRGRHLQPEEHHLPQYLQQAGRHLFQDHSKATQQHYLKVSFLKKLQIRICDYMISS